MKVVYNACFGGFTLSDKAVAYLCEKHGLSGDSYDLGRTLARHDPRLVDVVETLGADASGMCAKLEIEKIDGRLYRIDEYDGMESVETPNSTEWVVADVD